MSIGEVIKCKRSLLTLVLQMLNFCFDCGYNYLGEFRLSFYLLAAYQL